MEGMADAFGLEVMVTLLFLKEPFLLFHSYPVWAQLRVLRGKYVNQILRSLNLKMYWACTTPGEAQPEVGRGLWAWAQGRLVASRSAVPPLQLVMATDRFGFT